ncbi:protein FAM234B [Venturia canescens]|uniref:protein FAM234B n=1 Tax=Venturia canescens TaxID=32260 RepID=UPI001C9D4DD5|nr:protein FAM234B [Venturia canescens]
MSIERMSGQGYAPIPQCMSNTDTEDEDERLAIPIENNHEDQAKTHDTVAAQENGWYHNSKEPKNFAKDPVDSQGGYRYCGDDVPIMVTDNEAQNDFWKRREMSLLRRFCLVLSVLFCCATALVFLYALPCDNAVICPPVMENQPVITWEKTLEGVELHGPISVVHGTPYSLIFLLLGQRFGVNRSVATAAREIPAEGGVVLSMQGNTGTLLWWVPLQKKWPTDINCTTFDADGSETPDCIVSGENLLLSIDPTAGTIHWTSLYPTKPQLPLIIPDVDSDGIDDLLSVTQNGYPQGGIILLSGKNGKYLGEHMNSDCESFARNSIRIIRLESNGDISYICKGKTSPNQMLNVTVPLNELLHANNSDLAEVKSNRVFNESTTPENRSEETEIPSEYTIQLTPYYQLNVRNFGSCPGEDCRVSANVTLQKISKSDRIIWNHTSENTYAMKPAIYSIGDKPYVTGFAIKFWQWEDHEKSYDEKVEKWMKRQLFEKVLMVFVNYTDVHEIYASESDIIQYCSNDDCQPNLKLQTRSIAIADLGGDGTWELINYRSSYTTELPIVIVSKVQIVKLDADLSPLTQTN